MMPRLRRSRETRHRSAHCHRR